jgi:branched-chain amino acid transport system substrate-binding protein
MAKGPMKGAAGVNFNAGGGGAKKGATAFWSKEAMEAAGSCDKAKVSEALHKIDMKTGPATLFPGGRIKFDEKGRRVDSDIVVVQWQDGEPRLIYPAAVAAAPVKWAKP